ncbi:MAG TPA: twin-arginine translocation signal domain-containing protein [Kofleriaceae bacterium]|nr:twin-arginine translocation signal domain-containing protein [Kofleriaceae bacterium]
MTQPLATPAPATKHAKPSRRGFLGGALAVTLAAVLLPTDRAVTPKKKWETGKTRWIGHW